PDSLRGPVIGPWRPRSFAFPLAGPRCAQDYFCELPRRPQTMMPPGRLCKLAPRDLLSGNEAEPRPHSSAESRRPLDMPAPLRPAVGQRGLAAFAAVVPEARAGMTKAAARIPRRRAVPAGHPAPVADPIRITAHQLRGLEHRGNFSSSPWPQS